MKTHVLVLIALLGGAGTAAADVIYSYVGDAYTDIVDLPRPDGTFDTSMRITGSFVLANALAVEISGHAGEMRPVRPRRP